MPAFYELASLVDPSQTEPALPNGHPFLNIQSVGFTDYWTAQKDSEDDSKAFFVRMANGAVNRDPKTGSYFVWCVRGPISGPSVY